MLPNNDYAQRRALKQGRQSYSHTIGGGTAVAGGISCFGVLLIWVLLKVVPIWILIVNIIMAIQAGQAGTIDHFDFTWLVISAILTIVL